MVNFVFAVAHYFCHNLPAGFSQPGNGNLAEHSTGQPGLPTFAFSFAFVAGGGPDGGSAAGLTDLEMQTAGRTRTDRRSDFPYYFFSECSFAFKGGTAISFSAIQFGKYNRIILLLCVPRLTSSVSPLHCLELQLLELFPHDRLTALFPTKLLANPEWMATEYCIPQRHSNFTTIDTKFNEALTIS